MSSGMSPCWAWTIEKKYLMGLLKKPYKHFLEALDKAGVPFDEFAMLQSQDEFNHEPEDEAHKAVTKAYEELCAAFQKKTKLDLYINYHSTDEGDIYDDVNGGFFEVGGEVQKFTPAGLRLRGKIKHSSWVIYG